MIRVTGAVVLAPESRAKMLALGATQATNSRAEEGGGGVPCSEKGANASAESRKVLLPLLAAVIALG